MAADQTRVIFSRRALLDVGRAAVISNSAADSAEEGPPASRNEWTKRTATQPVPENGPLEAAAES
jgi:hypothetical protein